MREIRCSDLPMVTGICDPNKSRARHHRSYWFHLKFFLNDSFIYKTFQYLQTALLKIGENGLHDSTSRMFDCFEVSFFLSVKVLSCPFCVMI